MSRAARHSLACGGPLFGGPLFVGPLFGSNMLNTPKSASGRCVGVIACNKLYTLLQRWYTVYATTAVLYGPKCQAVYV